MQNLPSSGRTPFFAPLASLLCLTLVASLTSCSGTPDATAAHPTTGSDLGPPLQRATGGKAYKTLGATQGLAFHRYGVAPEAGFAAETADPERSRELVARGDELLRHVHRDEALAAYVEAIRWAPDSAEAYEGLGRALLRVKRPEDALATFRTAVELDPQRVSAQRQMAMTHERLGRLDEAEAAWNHVLDLAPEDPTALARLPVVLYFQGDDAAARRAVADAGAAGADVPPQLLDLLGLLDVGQRAARPVDPAETARTPSVGSQVRVPSPEFPAQAYAVETSVAATHVDPDHVITVWTDGQAVTGPERHSRVAVGESLDGGLTWSSHILEAPASITTARQGDPMSAYDHRTGNLWVGGVTLGDGEKNGIFVARRRPDASGFDEPVVAWRAPGVDKPWMAAGVDPADADATNLYLVHTLGLQVSHDEGSTWTEPRPFEGFLGVQPRVGPGGELYIVYWDADDGIQIHRSLDGGRTLEGPIRVARRLDLWDSGDGSRFPGEFRVPPFAYLAVSPVDGRLSVVWFDTSRVQGPERDVDLYVATSEDRGETWSAPRMLLSDDVVPGDQFFPWIEYDAAGGLHAVFYDTRHRAQSDTDPEAWIDAYYAYSEDGETWSQHRLTDQPFSSAHRTWYSGQFLGDYNGLAVAGTRAYPFYSSAQDGESDVFIHKVDLEEAGSGPVALIPDSPCRTGSNGLCIAR